MQASLKQSLLQQSIRTPLSAHFVSKHITMACWQYVVAETHMVDCKVLSWQPSQASHPISRATGHCLAARQHASQCSAPEQEPCHVGCTALTWQPSRASSHCGRCLPTLRPATGPCPAAHQHAWRCSAPEQEPCHVGGTVLTQQPSQASHWPCPPSRSSYRDQCRCCY
jgi:hypothetical protein